MSPRFLSVSLPTTNRYGITNSESNPLSGCSCVPLLLCGGEDRLEKPYDKMGTLYVPRVNSCNVLLRRNEHRRNPEQNFLTNK